MFSTNLSLGSGFLSFWAFFKSISSCFSDLAMDAIFFVTNSSDTEIKENITVLLKEQKCAKN